MYFVLIHHFIESKNSTRTCLPIYFHKRQEAGTKLASNKKKVKLSSLNFTFFYFSQETLPVGREFPKIHGH